MGSFLLASAYVSANANWKELEQELELLSQTSDRLHAPLQPEALIQVRHCIILKFQIDYSRARNKICKGTLILATVFIYIYWSFYKFKTYIAIVYDVIIRGGPDKISLEYLV